MYALCAQECAEVLCARVDVDTVKRDRWNRTPLDVATPNCKEILLNKGNVYNYSISIVVVYGPVFTSQA